MVKSYVFFSKNILYNDSTHLSSMLGMEISSGKGKYLELPYLIGRKKWDIFAYVPNWVSKEPRRWKEKLLRSTKCRQGNTKSVLQAISSYVMSVFLLPKSLCDEINQWLSKSGVRMGTKIVVCVVRNEMIWASRNRRVVWVFRILRFSIFHC